MENSRISKQLSAKVKLGYYKNKRKETRLNEKFAKFLKSFDEIV